MKLKYKDQEIEFEKNQTLKEVMKDIIEHGDVEEVIAARLNNSIVSLNTPLVEDGEVELLNRYNSKDGRHIYTRGLLFIMSKAFSEVYPKALLTVNYQLTNAMYGTADNMEITQEVVDKVKAKMVEIIEKDLPITKVMMTQEEAEEFYKREETIKGRLQTDIDKDKVSLYYCEDYFNYFFGTMPISTGFAKLFDFVKFRDGFLVKYPSSTEPFKIQKNTYTSLKLVSAMDEYEEIYRLLKINTVYRLNKKIREPNGVKELILFSEALHEKKIAEIADNIKKRNNVRMVLIAGPSSSGKTTFANKLGMSLRVHGIKPVTISVDNYFVERDQNPKDENGNYDFECIEALDLELFNQQLIDLLAGKEVELPRFNFKTGKKEYNGNFLRLKDDEILIIEGIHCLNDKLTYHIPKEFKYKVYISDLTVLNVDYYNRISTTDTRLIRRIVRDYNFRGYSALQTLKTWYSVKRGEEKNIFPYQDEADVMFNSSIVYELSVLKKYVMPLLAEIPRTEREYSEARRIITLLKYFSDMSDELIPNNSLLREFIGGSIFE